MIETRGGFLISRIKQIQGRVFDRLLTEAGFVNYAKNKCVMEEEWRC